MVENTRQRLVELKHSQKTVDRSYTLLQVKTKPKNSHFEFIYLLFNIRHNTIKHSMILMKHIIFIDNYLMNGNMILLK